MKSLLFSLIVLLIAVAAHAQDSTQQQFVGKYKFPEGSAVPEVNVTIESGTLMMSSTAGTSSLQLVKGDTFSIISFNGIAVFKRNEGNKVVGVHIDASGYVLDGVKETAGIAISAMNREGYLRRNYLPHSW